MKLVTDWKSGIRLYSVQAMGAALMLQTGWGAYVMVFAEAVDPQWTKTVAAVTAFLMVGGIIGRFIAQDTPAKE